MPPKNKFTKEEIVNAAIRIASKGGLQAVTARSLGNELGSSTKVIFGLFENMEELHGEIIKAALSVYERFTMEDIQSGKYPDYKATGMAYIRFASEETELFKLLYMRDRSFEKPTDDSESLAPLFEMIQKNTGLSYESARLLHLEMWIFVHGIAVMIATGHFEPDAELVSRMITDVYNGVKDRFIAKEVL